MHGCQATHTHVTPKEIGKVSKAGAKARGWKQPATAHTPTNLCNRALRQQEQRLTQKIQVVEMESMCVNDPSAGSPTETLLRLLLPLSDKVH